MRIIKKYLLLKIFKSQHARIFYPLFSSKIRRVIYSYLVRSPLSVLEDGNPVGDVYYGDLVTNYDKERSFGVTWIMEDEQLRLLIMHLADKLPKTPRLLDVPIGTGRFLDTYKENNFMIYGADISNDMLAMAVKNSKGYRIEVDQADASNLKYPDKYFDLLVSVRFLQGMIPEKSIKEVLLEFSRVSRFGILEFAAREGETNASICGFDITNNKAVLYRYNIEELKSIFKTYNIKVIKISDQIIENDKGCNILFLVEFPNNV